MSWNKLCLFQLIGSNMCFGQKNFSPYIPDTLMYGLEKGTYRISYVSGAIRSHNSQRFISFLPKQLKIQSLENSIDEINGKYYQSSINTWTKYNLNSSDIITINLEDNIFTIYKNNNKLISFSEDIQEFQYNNKLYNFITKSTYQYKWNKFYNLQYNLESLKNYDFSFFPQLKYAVFQCQYGTLPGFTPFGYNTIELAEYYAKGKNIPLQLYNLVSSYIKPLEFTLQKKNSISFWYNDDCAPCVEGSITYQLEKYINNSNVVINSFGVLSYNIQTLETQAPEYYKVSNQQTIETADDYITQHNYIDINSNITYIKNLQKFNTLGYYNNSSNYKNNKNMYVSYINLYDTKYNQDLYWEIEKIKPTSNIDLLAKIDSTEYNIPLFLGTYTIIPSTSKYLSGQITTLNTQFNNQNLQFYTFSLNNTTLLSFNNCKCFLYSGMTTKENILSYYNTTYNNNQQTIEKQKDIEKIQLLSDISLVNYNFYLYISPNKDFIQIISNIQQDIINQYIIQENSNYLIGPFNTIEQAQKQIDKYCILNGLEYSKINQNYFSIGIK